MDWLDSLVEARMRDWERRVREGTAPPAPEPSELAPGLEVALWREIVSLHALADPASGEEREALSRRAQARELQLWVLLESTGRPLAARRLQGQLARMRHKESPG